MDLSGSTDALTSSEMAKAPVLISRADGRSTYECSNGIDQPCVYTPEAKGRAEAAGLPARGHLIPSLALDIPSLQIPLFGYLPICNSQGILFSRGKWTCTTLIHIPWMRERGIGRKLWYE